jgi:metallophosphoesterase superfamily enzyme
MAATKPPSTEVRADVWIDGRRALWLAVPRLLVVADLHWGYVSSHRASGNLLPEWGDGEIAGRLAALLADYRPAEMVWLGDSLHTLAGRAAAEAFIDQAGLPVVVIAGNHDFRWKRAADPHVARAGYFLHHGHKPYPRPEGHVEVIGHHHPAVTWYDGAGGRLKMPALVVGEQRLILPAFSPWSAGTPWNGNLLPGERLWAVSARRIFAVPVTPAVVPEQRPRKGRRRRA